MPSRRGPGVGTNAVANLPSKIRSIAALCSDVAVKYRINRSFETRALTPSSPPFVVPLGAEMRPDVFIVFTSCSVFKELPGSFPQDLGECLSLVLARLASPGHQQGDAMLSEGSMFRREF